MREATRDEFRSQEARKDGFGIADQGRGRVARKGSAKRAPKGRDAGLLERFQKFYSRIFCRKNAQRDAKRSSLFCAFCGFLPLQFLFNRLWFLASWLLN